MKFDTPQAAYARINELMDEANAIKNSMDKVVNEAHKIARANGLLFQQRFSDALPECLNPDYYEEKEVTDYRGRRVIEKVFKDNLPKKFLDENYVEAGDPIEQWIPSSLC